MTDDLVEELRKGWTEDGICENFDEDVLLVAADRIEELIFGPGGIMEMKQTIADKEKRIAQLEAALRKTHSVLFMSIDYRGYEGGPLSMPFASLAEREASAALGEKKDD